MKVNRKAASKVTKITFKGEEMLLLDPPEWVTADAVYLSMCPGKALAYDPEDMDKDGPVGFLTETGLVVKGSIKLGNKKDIEVIEVLDVEFFDD
jgi:hypothetical protein